MKTPTPNTNGPHCKNCTQPIIDSAKFCSHCGQKNTDGRISIGSFFSALFSTVFNLESKFFQTIGHIFIPGKLTIEYFKGKHKRYFHPVRFFIVSALLLIAVLGYQMSGDMGMTNIQKRIEKQLLKEKFLTEMDSVVQQTLAQFPTKNSLKPAFDTLYHNLKGEDSNTKDSISVSNLFTITDKIDDLDLEIANEDFINLSIEELLEKYKVENTFDRFLLKQKLKLSKDGDNFGSFVLGNSLWIILLMMPFLALILKILYIRQGYYYVEHLVFSFHSHAFAFLLFAFIGFIVNLGAPNQLMLIGFLFLFVYLFQSLRKVYGQNKFITIVKLLLINGVYFFLFLFFLVFGLIASMAIF